MTMCHLDRSIRVEVKPSESLRRKEDPLARSGNTLSESSTTRLQNNIIPPLNTTSGTVLSDVRAQFEMAFTKISSSNKRHDASMRSLNDRPMRLGDLTSSTSNLGRSTRLGRSKDDDVIDPEVIEKVQITTDSPPDEFKQPLPVANSHKPIAISSLNTRMASPITTPTKKSKPTTSRADLEPVPMPKLSPRSPSPKKPSTPPKRKAPPPPPPATTMSTMPQPDQIMMPFPAAKAERPRPMTTNLFDSIRHIADA